jgi:uncharacterized membrane protein
MFVIVALMLVPASSDFTPISSNSLHVSPNPSPVVSTNTASTNPDFNISATPGSITIGEGATTHSTITLTSLSGFAGQVYLSSSSIIGTITSLDITNVTLTSGGTASATLTLTVPNDALLTQDLVTVEANSGCTLIHAAFIDLTITRPDFTISTSKTETTISPGSSDTATIDLASVSSFAGLVILTPFADSPVLAGLNVSSIELSSGGTGAASFTIYVPVGTQAGNYTVSVDGENSDFSLFHSVDITVVVPGLPGPGFSLSSNHDLTLIAGGVSNSSTITITASGGFVNWVDLSIDYYTPGILPILTPLSVSLPPSGTSTLTVSAPIGTREGEYEVSITGTSGSLTNYTDVYVEVEAPDFFIFPSQFELTMQAGQTCTSTLTAQGIDGFTGPVDLTASPSTGLTGTLSPSSVSVPSSPTSTLTIKTASNVGPGFYSVNITGTSNALGINETTAVYVTVIGPEFNLFANPSSLTISPGGSGTSTIFLSGENGFSGTVTLGYSAPAGVTASFSPSSISGVQSSTMTVSVSSGSFPGTEYDINVTGTGGSQASPTIVSVLVASPLTAGGFSLSDSQTIISLAAGTSQTASVTISANGGFTGPAEVYAYPSSIDLNASLSASLVTTFPQVATLSVNSTVPGVYSVDVSGAGGTSFQDLTVIVVVTGPDFTLSASPSSLTITAGSSETSTISITPSGGFINPVTFTATSPQGITVTIGSETSPVVTISVDPAIAPGSYTVDVNGASGLLSRDVIITVNVASFQLNIVPDTITIPQNGSGVSTVQIGPMNGFSGKVTTSTVSPSGLSPTPATNSLTSGTYQLTVNVGSAVSAGTYLVNITGTSGTLSQNATLTVTVTLAQPDFTIAPSTPATVDCTTGGACSETITITSLDSFNGAVTFTAFPSPGLTCTTPASVTGSGTSTLNCQSSTAADYAVVVYATSGVLSHPTAVITYHVVQSVDFKISATSPSVVNAGQSATSTITVSAVSGFTGTVTLTDTSTGLTCAAITPGTITGSGTATVSCSATATGTYTLTVTGTSGTLVHTATATFNFVDFNIAASSPAAVNAGQSATSTITITAVNGFAGVVTLTDTVPSGLTCGAITPGTVTGSGTATVSCSATVAGTYVLTITGTSGSLVHTATATFNFAGFTITASSPAAVNAGLSATSTISVTPVNGFTGVVTLSDTVPSGLTCGAFTPGTVTGSGTATVSCSATVAGTYVLTVTGTTGSLIQTATTTFNFVDFTIAATSPTGGLSLPTPSTITVAGLNGFTGTVTLTDTVPSGDTCNAISPTSVTGSGTATLSCSSPAATTFTVTITGTSGSLSHSVTATFTFTTAPDFGITATSPATVNAGQSAASTITVTALNGFGGVVTLTDTVPSALTCGAITPGTVTGSGTATVSCNASTAGPYTLTIKGSSTSPILSHSTTAAFNFVDFTIGASSPAALDAGSSASSTITINPLNGFTGTVTLTDTAPAGLTCQAITPNSVVNSGTATISCKATPAGTYVLTVIGTSGTLAHSTTATFNFEDFAVTASTPSTVGAGNYVTSTITITPQNGFAGTVTFTDTPASGLSCQAITPATITGAGTASVSCEASTATSYTLTIDATSGSLTHSVTATFTYATPDFTVITSVSSLSFNSGTSGTATITVAPEYGFSGTITLAVTSPSGVSCSLSSTTIQSSGTSTLTCTGSVAGAYTVTITSTAGTIVNTTNLTVHVAAVSPAAPAATILGLAPVIFYIIIAVIIVAVIAGATLLLRKPKLVKP